MFKVSSVIGSSAKREAVDVMDRIYRENPKNWPFGLDPDGFDGGLYLIREKQANTPVGFCGWQERNEIDGSDCVKVGYYSIGILPEYRRNGFAKQALNRLIATKAAGVDHVRALILESNAPSRALANDLGVSAILKRASFILR
jgi:RimJ/RimL family protein N-acetyltransferase